jgi:glyoxalase family protein
MESPVTEGFHHVTMVSSDVVRTLAFYRDLLGLELVKKTVDFDDPAAYHLYFGVRGGAPGTLLTFLGWPRAARGERLALPPWLEPARETIERELAPLGAPL